MVNYIDSLLKRIHGDNKHLGRKCIHNNVGVDAHSDPQKGKKTNDNKQSEKINNKENKLEKLQKDLKKAIADERYEDAAKIRDEIKKFETRDIP